MTINKMLHQKLPMASAACLLVTLMSCTAVPEPATTSETESNRPEAIESQQPTTDDLTAQPVPSEPEQSTETTTDDVPFLEPGDFAISGLTIGSDVEDAIAQLGEPDRKEEYFLAGDPNGTWIYDSGTTLYTNSEKIWGMTTSDTNLCTASGVCPGNDFNTVVETLGTNEISTDEKGRHVTYSPAAEEEVVACWMEVYLEDSEDTVRDLRLACQP
ncbi:MAG: hypothetical protein AAFR58_15510 [Cyanobacteria bacterium J06627_28]